MAVISANYMGDYFQVVVHDQGSDMQRSSEWQTGTDFVNDLWLFQTEAGDQTKLIIRFSHGSTGYTADLFDDVNDDGTVSYELHAGNQVAITESPFPTVQFIAQQPWILSSGNVNYLVHIQGYRPLYDPITASYGEESLDFIPHDGSLAMEDEIVDSADGIPDYELIEAYPDVPLLDPISSRALMSVSEKINNQPLQIHFSGLTWDLLIPNSGQFSHL